MALQVEFFGDNSQFTKLSCSIDVGKMTVIFKHLRNEIPRLFECNFQLHNNGKKYVAKLDDKPYYSQYIVSWNSSPCDLLCEDLTDRIARFYDEKTWISEFTYIMLIDIAKEIDFVGKRIKNTEGFDKFLLAYKKRNMT